MHRFQFFARPAKKEEILFSVKTWSQSIFWLSEEASSLEKQENVKLDVSLTDSLDFFTINKTLQRFLLYSHIGRTVANWYPLTY